MKNRVLLLGLLAALPVLANDGFKVGINSGFMKANVDSAYSLGYYRSQSDATNYRYVFAEYADQMPLGLDLGYKLGNDEFRLSYFQTYGTNTQVNAPTASSYYYSDLGNSSYVYPQTGQTILQGKTLDLKWIHPFATGPHGTWTMSLGVRYGVFENSLKALGSDGEGGYSYENYHAKTKAFGPTAGLGFSYPLTKSLSVGADYSLAYLQGSTEFNEAYQSSSTSTPNSYSIQQSNLSFTQKDLIIHIDWKVTEALEATVGYRNLSYGGVTNYPWNYYNYNTPVSGWGLSGVTFGINCSF